MHPFKIDVDVKMSKSLLKKFIETRKVLLKHLGYKVKEVNKKESRRGHHLTILVTGKVPATKANAIQFLLGDDPSRCIINARRIKRRIPWREGNKLFSKTLWRKKHKCNCKIHQKILKRMKEGQEEFEKMEWEN